MNELRDKIHANAVKKGFWKKERELGTLLMLVVSELSEALESDRKSKTIGEMAFLDFSANNTNRNTKKFVKGFEKVIKGTVEEEIADSMIRLLDICGAYNIDIDLLIELKMAYNETRPKMHGKKY
jgi:NTP pyrophosphatase (non-canonical NTP hydrolase)